MAAGAQEVNFAGRVVEVMVNFAAGSATDSAARMVANYLPDHLPGHPNVIVTNRAGAGGTAAVDYLIDSVAPDGMVIGYFSGTALRWALGMEQVREGTGDLPYVAAKSVNQIVLARKDSKLNFETLPGNNERIFLAINSPDSHFAIRMRFLADAIGMSNFSIITGYETQPRMIAAVRASEVSIAQANDTFFGSSRDALLGDGVMETVGQMGEYAQGGIVSQGGLEDIPVFDALWRSASPDTIGSPEYRAWEALHIAMTLQNLFALPPGTPQPVVAVWEKALLAAYADPRYVDQLKQLGLPDSKTIGSAEIRARMDSAKASFEDPAVRAAIESAIEKNMR
jgi:tripartite-type tricarboxylate transporter receptor subunit TctC